MITQTKAEGLKLVIENQNRVVQDATVPVRWTISEELSEKLIEKQIKNPHLLLFVVADGKEMGRELIPLTQKTHYVQLHKPGKNTIFAKIVCGKYRELWDEFLKRYRNEYYTNIVDNDGAPCSLDSYNVYRDNGYHEIEANLSVEVPEELFAQKSSEWLTNWVNSFFNETPIDQCHFRKRMIFAFTIQPILTPFIILYRGVIIAELLILGMRNINFRPLFHPFSCSNYEIKRNVQNNNSIFYARPKNKDSEIEFSFWISFHPVFWIASFILATLVDVFGYLPNFTSIIFATAIFIAIVPVIIMAGILLVLAIKLTPSSIVERFEKVVERLRKNRLQTKLESRKNLFSSLTHNGNVLPPLRQRSIILHYEAFKALVCKPYAK